ncbi:MAG: M43 family zinc metalloprotease [Bacteroidota bacterium]
MKKIIFLSVLFFLSALITSAQNTITGNSTSSQNGITNADHCGTMPHLQWMMQQDPALQQKMEQEEKKFDDYIDAYSNELNNKTAYTIPVVVHVVYNGSSGYVSPARVTEQIDRTNSDWAGLSTHSMEPFPDSLKANSEITLCLATVNPGGNPTTGIDYKTTTVSNWTYNNNVKYSSTGGADAWDVTKYLNIWVCNLGGGLCGYAQFPTSGINNTYGVVIHYQFFGITGASAPYNEGGTMSHELGHCFNLFHLFGDVTCTDGDGCPDTPTEYGTQSVIGNCVIDQCNDTCPGIMYMNFMSYSDDSTMANLTPDQGTRMQACISMYLMSVSNNSYTACGIANPCSAQFNLYPDTAMLHHYYAVNMATGVPPLTYLWSWGDGTYDTIAYPSHVYDTAGYYNICLTISDFVGCSNTFCDSSYYIQKSGNTVITVNVIPLGTVEIQEDHNNPVFIIYPNPAENNITVESIYSYPSENIFSIFDIQGKLMLHQILKKANTVIDISHLTQGLYFVKVESNRGIEIMKLVIE